MWHWPLILNVIFKNYYYYYSTFSRRNSFAALARSNWTFILKVLTGSPPILILVRLDVWKRERRAGTHTVAGAHALSKEKEAERRRKKKRKLVFLHHGPVVGRGPWTQRVRGTTLDWFRSNEAHYFTRYVLIFNVNTAVTSSPIE